MTVKLLTEHHLECRKLVGGCTGSTESALVKMLHYSKSHVPAHIMKKVNKQCLLDTPRTVRVSEKTWQVIVQTRRPYFDKKISVESVQTKIINSF